MRILNLVKEIPLGIKYNISSYPDGQQNIDIIDNDFISYSKSNPVTIKSRLNNWKDLELICAANACLKQLEVPEIHLYVPYFLGSRSDRRFTKGGNNYLKDIICPIINLQGFKSVTVLDPHSDVLEACLNGFKKISNEELVSWVLNSMDLEFKTLNNGSIINSILVSPDAGASKKVYKIQEYIKNKHKVDLDVITCSKDRDENGKLTKCVVPYLLQELTKDIIVIDDIGDGFGTFINIIKEARNQGYIGKSYLIVTHSIQEEGIHKTLKFYDTIYTTNSVKNWDIERLKYIDVF